MAAMPRLREVVLYIPSGSFSDVAVQKGGCGGLGEWRDSGPRGVVEIFFSFVFCSEFCRRHKCLDGKVLRQSELEKQGLKSG